MKNEKLLITIQNDYYKRNKYNEDSETETEPDYNSDDTKKSSINNINYRNKRGRKNSFDDEDYKSYTSRRKYSDIDRELDDKIYKKSKNCEYFRKQNRDKQIDILNKEDEIYNYFKEEIPLRYRIIYSNIPLSTKSLIIQKIDQYESMNKYDSEYSKLGKWLRGISLIPFGNFVDIPVKFEDPSHKIESFLHEAHLQLEKTIYGQNEAKNKILQIMAQWISNPSSRGQMIALEGPPGVGKTSLVKQGVSKALNRPFCFYALGGATDASNLEGHSYTYEGATWGRIVEMLMEAKVMNPVVFFDELDKISDTSRGHEISSILTHLTDPSQNTTFYDKYYSEIPFDISRTLFFFSYNDKELINPILKDRLTVIKFDGYQQNDKLKIAINYIIPELMENQGFKKEDLIWTEDNIKYILQKYCKDEKGVRNLRRCIEDIIMKINLLRLMNKKEIKEEITIVHEEIKNDSNLIIKKNKSKFNPKNSKKIIINDFKENKILNKDIIENKNNLENNIENKDNKIPKIINGLNIPYWIDDFKLPCSINEKMIDIFMKSSSLIKEDNKSYIDSLYI